MKYLITGGLGFIGVNLLKKLLQDSSNEIHIIDSKPTGLSHKQITFLNRSTSEDLTSLKDKNFDALILLGSKSGKDVEDIEVTDNRNILELMAENKLKIIFPSTQLIYEDPENSGFETDSDYRLDDLYTKSKISMENEIISNSHANPNHTYTIFRISNPYGIHFPSAQSYNIANQLLFDLIQNKEIMIYGNGDYKKNFIPIVNVVRIFIESISKNLFSNEVINLGMPEDILIGEFYKKAQGIFSSGKIVFDAEEKMEDSKIKISRLLDTYDKDDLISHDEQLYMMKDFYSDYKTDSTFDEFIRKLWDLK